MNTGSFSQFIIFAFFLKFDLIICIVLGKRPCFGQPKELKKIFASYTSGRELISRIYQELKNRTKRKKTQSINKGVNKVDGS